jgi:hypothetical protein
VKLSCAKRALSLSSLSHSSPGDTDGQFGDPPAVGERRGSRGEQWCEGDAGADPQGAAACGSYGVDTGSSRRWIGLPRRASDGSASPGEPRRRDVRLGAHDERLHPTTSVDVGTQRAAARGDLWRTRGPRGPTQILVQRGRGSSSLESGGAKAASPASCGAEVSKRRAGGLPR